MDKPFTSASFYGFVREKKLMGSRCKGCGRLHLPPRPLCPSCRSDKMEWTELSGKGKLAAFTAIAVGTSQMIKEGYDRANLYYSGIVELNEGPRISARILTPKGTEPESVAIGHPANIAFLKDEHGDIRPVVAFEI